MLLVVCAAGPVRASDFANFESSQVHPLALSPDGTKLFAVNTPDARLSIFDVDGVGSLELSAEIAVGIEPVSLAVSGDEVWVVNHISDSVSVIDVSRQMLVATIRTGDEPTDVVFAAGKAFVSHAGVRDHVRVYDAVSRNELAQIEIFGDDPRALAASADGSEVYLVVLESGNRTASFSLADGEELPDPSPPKAYNLPQPPKVSLIVQFNEATGFWEDETGQTRGDQADLDVPDHDLFVIDSASLAVVRTVRSIGTSLFDVAVQPGTGKLWVPNTDARNLVRFEPNLRGHFVDTRLTTVDSTTAARSHLDLNPHIDFGVTPGPAEEIAQSIATPGDLAFTADGSACYLASFGTAKVAVIDTSTGTIGRIAVGGGPSGLALSEDNSRLYVLNRFDNTISVVDTVSNQQIATEGIAGDSLFDPSPDEIRLGRRLLYDAETSSGHGDSSCASCHVFGNFDGIGWDLGNPVGQFEYYGDIDWLTFDTNPVRSGFHPMKGPMVTQTLRGLDQMEPFHWRGDRRDFQHFNGAFVGLMGRAEPLPDEQMDLFADFTMTIRMPPNPLRTPDDELPATVRVMDADGLGSFVDADPASGAEFFFDGLDAERRRNCVDCHSLPNGTSNVINSSLVVSQDFKVAHLRNVYEKVGFGRVAVAEYGNVAMPQQKSGFGILHAGATSLAEFLIGYFVGDGVPLEDQQDIAAFVMAFPTGTPPVVGRQLTIDPTSARTPASDAEVALLLDQAALGKCDVVVRGVIGGQARSFVYDAASSLYRSDSRAEAPIGDVALRSLLADGDVATYTAVPAGTGVRTGIDRDRDTWLDGDELVGGSDATDVVSTPVACEGRTGDSIERAGLKLKLREDGVDVSVKGEADLTGLADPSLDLQATGFIVDVRDAEGTSVFRRWIRPGVLSAPEAGEWRMRDRTGTVASGIRKASVRMSGERFRFAIRGRVSDVESVSPSLPLSLVVLFGTAEQDIANQCARLELDESRCRQKPGSISCR